MQPTVEMLIIYVSRFKMSMRPRKPFESVAESKVQADTETTEQQKTSLPEKNVHTHVPPPAKIMDFSSVM